MYLVTGYGSIGSLVVKKLLKKYPDEHILILDKNEEAIYRARIELAEYNIKAIVGDVANRWDLEKLFHHWIKCVVHTAAMKHVTFCEDNPHLAAVNNVLGINNLLELCKLNSVEQFVNVSTDKCAYPANVMGATKFIAERSVISYNNISDGIGQYQSTRLGNVLCSTGSLIPTIRRIIKNKAKLQITDLAATRFFITKDEVSDFIVEMATEPKSGQVLIKKLKSATLETMINAVFKIVGEYPYDVVGLRQGEKLHEHLFTATENTHMIDHGEYWSIDFNRTRQEPIKVIDSSNPECLVSEDKLVEILKKVME